MFRKSSPRARVVKTAALAGAAVGAILSLFAGISRAVNVDFSSEGLAYSAGFVVGVLLAAVVIIAACAAVGALIGLVIAVALRLPGKRTETGR